MKLRIIDDLHIVEKRPYAAISGNLICQCGALLFYVDHSGRQTRGILSPYVVKNRRQIRIDAKCCDCGKTIRVFDSTEDGIAPMTSPTYPMKRLVISGVNKFGLTVYFNFDKDHYMTNSFSECIIEASSDSFKKDKIIFE